MNMCFNSCEATESQGTILSVGQLTDFLRKDLENSFPFVWVKGEVSNLGCPTSGHIYFCLKDDVAQINCVWFRSSRKSVVEEKFDPLTGEVYEQPRPALSETIRNGQELVCAGRISVYGPRGQYQLIIEFAQDNGEGVLALEFEQRKRRLDSAGYFSMERKRCLPRNPARVALVTSPHGAAIHDFLEIASKRGLSCEIRLYPSAVQGDGAAESISSLIREINGQNWAQVIVIVRGGGSKEDLWAFNEECIATEIFNSHIPVLTGIGHEVDTSLADLTADVRAATPSHAAQLLFTPREEIAQRLDDLELGMDAIFDRYLALLYARLEKNVACLRLQSPLMILARMRNRLDNIYHKLASTIIMLLKDKGGRLEKVQGMLCAQDPLAPLEHGYALVRNSAGQVIISSGEIERGDMLKLLLRDGEVAVRAEEVMTQEEY